MYRELKNKKQTKIKNGEESGDSKIHGAWQKRREEKQNWKVWRLFFRLCHAPCILESQTSRGRLVSKEIKTKAKAKAKTLITLA
jgi:hypothetical protein